MSHKQSVKEPLKTKKTNFKTKQKSISEEKTLKKTREKMVLKKEKVKPSISSLLHQGRAMMEILKDHDGAIRVFGFVISLLFYVVL